MMSLRARLAAILAVTSLSAGVALSAYAEDARPESGGKWDAWTELGGYGSNRSEARRGEAALWAPLMQNGRSVLFTDMRGKIFADEQREGNVALGYRFLGENGWNPGFWIGFDRRATALGSTFDQISLGGELLSADWDLRANAYLPLDDSAFAGSIAPSVEVIGGGLFLLPAGGLHELAFHGFDAEAGWRVPIERLGWHMDGGVKDGLAAPDASYHDLRVFLGGYYFDHDDFDGEIAGARVRAEWRIENVIEGWEGSRLTFEAAYQYDDVREDQIEAGLRLRIPLGHRAAAVERHALSPQEKRIAEGIRRDTDIVSVSQTRRAEGSAPEPVEDALSGVDLNNVVFVPNDGHLGAALVDAGPNSLIIVNGGAVTFHGIMLFTDQTLLGGGGELQLRGRTTGTLATYTAPGVRPFIGNCCVGIFAHDNAHISGVAVVNNATSGIEVWLPDSSIFISNTLIDTAFVGISIPVDNAVVTVRNTTIQNVLIGVYADAESPVLDMRGGTIRNALEAGIGMFPSNDIASLTVADTTFDGIIGIAAFGFVSGTTTVTSSTGNVDSMTFGERCARDDAATFTGSIGFSDASITAADCVSLGP
jgi:hypothetical protein